MYAYVRFREARADPKIQIGFVIFVIYVFDLNNMSVLVFIKKNHFFEIKIFENHQFSQLLFVNKLILFNPIFLSHCF